MPIFETTNNTSSSSQTGNRVPVSFAETVAANNTETLRYPVPRDGTIEMLWYRFYRGPRLDLRLQIYVDHEEDEAGQTNLLRQRGKTYIDGENDAPPGIQLSVPVEQGDDIVVEAENLNSSFSYDYRVITEIDYAGGLSRWLGGLL